MRLSSVDGEMARSADQQSLSTDSYHVFHPRLSFPSSLRAQVGYLVDMVDFAVLHGPAELAGGLRQVGEHGMVAGISAG
jgi:hypothetical protein